MSTPPATRVLQILPDTDDSPRSALALSLHGDLARRGLELRTLALAPGRRGELAATLPAIAPARRSLAALAAVRAEARWADVVVFHGPGALPPGRRFLRSGPPVILIREPAEVVPDRTTRALGASLIAVLEGSYAAADAEQVARLVDGLGG